MNMCIIDSFCYIAESNTILYINYAPIQTFKRLYIFLLLNNIPLNICTTFYLFFAIVDEQLGCFYLLATVNNHAISIFYKYLFKSLNSFLFGIYLEVELLHYIVVLYLTFWETTKILFTAAALCSHTHKHYTRVPIFPYWVFFVCLFVFYSRLKRISSSMEHECEMPET